MIGIIINPDKTLEERDFTSLKAKQEVVKGLIEPISLTGDHTLWINEEFRYLFNNTDFNSIATDVCGLAGRPDIMLRDPILGPVILVGPPDHKGNDTDVTDEARNWVRRVAREAGGKWVDHVR